VYTFIECQFLICLYWLLLLNVLTKFCRHVLLLGIASKIEPPTHSHEILISTLLITGEDLSLSLSSSRLRRSLLIYSPFLLSLISLSVIWFGFQFKGSKVQGYQIPTRCLSRNTFSYYIALNQNKAKSR